jgi:hypothetical protein
LAAKDKTRYEAEKAEFERTGVAPPQKKKETAVKKVVKENGLFVCETFHFYFRFYIRQTQESGDVEFKTTDVR